MEKFFCPQCPKQYHNKYLLNMHIRASHEGTSFKCPATSCSKQFPSAGSLRLHSKTHNNAEPRSGKLFKCNYCPRTFAQNSNKNTHLKRVHLKERPMKCPSCKKAFSTTRELRKHSVQHVPDEDRQRLQCPKCPKVYLDTRGLKKHEILVHLKGGIECPFPNCGMKFISQYELKLHSITHVEDKASLKVFKCKQCLASFARSGELRTHVLRAHTAGNKRYTCSHENCKMEFITRAELNSHQVTHLEDRDRPVFTCATCPKTFLSRGSLSMHKSRCAIITQRIPCEVSDCVKTFLNRICMAHHVRRIHTSVTLYPCGFCPKSFKSNTERGNHLRCHHTMEKPFKCAYCGRRFTHNNTCKGHEKRKHTEVEKVAVFCTLCGSKYASKNGLAVHVRAIHENRRPYKCNLCQKAFQSNGNLKKHINCVHTKEKHFKCKRCGYGTCQLDYFKQHKRIHDVGNKRVSCYFCGKRFHTFWALKAHFHKHTSERCIKCSGCHKGFFRYGTRNNHQKYCSLNSLDYLN